MKTKESPMQMDSFYIASSNIAAIPNTANKKLPKSPVSVEFDILREDSKFRIVLLVSSNIGEKRVPGYSFQIAAEGVFSFSMELEKKIIDQYLLGSALSLLINNIRFFISGQTSQFPYGQYVFPLIDISELVQTKIAQKNKPISKKKVV